MDALEQYLIGGTTQSPITDDLLDRLKMVESSGNPKAVNKTSGALGAYQFMPDTVNMLTKQGVKFDPMDEKQSREAARTYLTQLYNQTGSIDKALAAYGGFKTADPTKYVQSIKGYGDPLEDYLSSGVIAPASAIAAPATPTVQNAMQKAFQVKQEIPQRIAGAADTLLNAIPQAIGGGTQFIERAFGIEGPKEAEQRGQAITEALSNPVGRLTGITGKQAYQKPLGGVTEPLAQQLNHYFNVMGITPEQLAEKTGKPVEDIRNIGNMLPFIAPEVAGALRTGAKAASGAISKALPEIEYTTAERQAAQQAAKDDLVGVGAASVNTMPFKGMTGEEYVSGPHPILKNTKVAQDVAPAEQAINATIIKEIVGDKGEVRTGPMTRNEDVMRNEYTEAKKSNPTPKGLVLKEQIANEQNALSEYAQKRIENTEAKNFATEAERGEHLNDLIYGKDDSIHGFIDTLKNDVYQKAKNRVGNNPIESTNIDSLLTDPQTLAGAKAAGTKHVYEAAKDFIELAKTTGFKDPITKERYAPNSINGFVATQKALNRTWTPETASAIHEINAAIDDDIFSAGGGDLFKRGKQIHQLDKTVFDAPGIKRVFGKIDENTQIKKGTPFEKMSKELNGMPDDQWRHVYNTFDQFSRNKIRGPIDLSTGMPAWEFDIPKEIQEKANRGMNELKGNLAREVYKEGAGNKGEWSAKKVHDAINSRWGKISSSFDPQEQRAFDVLNRGGWLMPGLHAYEGAALQSERLGNIVSNNLPATGAAITGAAATAMGVPPVIGSLMTLGGEKLGEKAQSSMTIKQLEKQAEAFRKQMKENSKKATQESLKPGAGTRLSDIGKFKKEIK